MWATMQKLRMRFGDIDDIRNYDDLSNAESEALLARVPRSGTELQYELQAPLVSFSAGRFAVGAGYQTVGSHGIAYDLAELFLRGYELGRRDFDVAATNGWRAGYMDLAVAHGRSFGPVSVGATAHLYRGGTLVRSQLLPVDVDLAGTTYSTTYFSVRSEGGTGFGLDLGVAAQPMPGLTVGASVSNLAGTMNWTEELRQRSVEVDRQSVESGSFEDLKYAFDRSDAPYTSHPSAVVQQMANTLLDGADLPRTVRLGASFDTPTGTQVAAAFSTVTNDTRLSGMWDQRLSVGVEQRLLFARLRAGLASNLDAGGMLSGGVGLGPVQVGIARITNGSVGAHDRTGWVYSFGLQTRSNTEVR
jgi:hypothetical protein